MGAQVGVGVIDRPVKVAMPTAPGLAPMAERWPKWKTEAFEAIDAACLMFVATDGPVSVTTYEASGQVKRRLGHNRGIWPAKFSKGSVRKDTATATYDKNPFFFIGTQFRLWARSAQERDKLVDRAVDIMAQWSSEHGGLEGLDHGFADMGDALDLLEFEKKISDCARQLGVVVWDDFGFSNFIDRVHARKQKIELEGRRGKFDPFDVAIAQEYSEAEIAWQLGG